MSCGSQQIATPEIADDEVLVRVHAAGLDRGTWHLMTGRPYLMRVMGFGFRAPKNPAAGIDVAGTVVAVGSGGDQVRASATRCTGSAVAASPSTPRPARTSSPQAGRTSRSSRPRWCRCRRSPPCRRSPTSAGSRTGQRVLIIGASGGVGSYAVQLAKAFGAEVTGVCSTAKLDLVRSLGADHVLDYTRDDFADGDARYDLIIDIAGNSPLSRLRRALTPAGTLVIVGGESKGNLTGGIERQLRALLLSPFVGQRLTMCRLPRSAAATWRSDSRELIEAGKVTPSIDRTYPLDQVPAAMRHLEAGKVRGKIAIRI